VKFPPLANPDIDTVARDNVHEEFGPLRMSRAFRRSAVAGITFVAWQGRSHTDTISCSTALRPWQPHRSTAGPRAARHARRQPGGPYPLPSRRAQTLVQASVTAARPTEDAPPQ